MGPAQALACPVQHVNNPKIRLNLVAILKARQLGLTWLCIAYALWLMIFRPGSTILLFSRRDDEAKELLSRLVGMLIRLPAWMQPTIGTNNDHELSFKNLNSVARSFPTTKHSGRSFTATLVIVDEADFIPWLPQLLAAVKPTVDAGGRMILLSTSNKEQPKSEFKTIWQAGANNQRLRRHLPPVEQPARP